MKANRKFTRDEDAVSPVIGVILMVAITVIMAAVIAAFVFDMSNSLHKLYMVTATASQQGTTITVTFSGGPDATEVTALAASINDTAMTGASFANGTVGSSATGTGTAGRNDHITVVATFNDGSEQVILDTFV